MNDKYKIPSQTRIGHVHLKVSDIQKSLKFYRDLLGFDLVTMYGNQAAFISAGGYHHHIGLNIWESENSPSAQNFGVGLYHVAILFPTRKDLAEIFYRLMNAKYPISGTSDHGVSEAIYLDDPDGNRIELYWDKPNELWPQKPDGSIEMFTKHFDLENLLSELDNLK